MWRSGIFLFALFRKLIKFSRLQEMLLAHCLGYKMVEMDPFLLSLTKLLLKLMLSLIQSEKTHKLEVPELLCDFLLFVHSFFPS